MRLGLSSFLTLCLAIMYSLMVWLLQQAKLWDWLNTLAATGISFFLALVAGIYLFNQQTKANRKSSHDDLHTLLAAELSDLLRIFNDTSRMGLDFTSGRKVDVLITYVQPLVIEKAALSGLFSAAESETCFTPPAKSELSI